MEIFSKIISSSEKEDNVSTILVIEDDPNVRKFVAVNLIKRGHEVVEGENGHQALEHLHEHKPDLIVLDIKLPDISGWDILDHLNSMTALPGDLPVLVMTASPVNQDGILSKYPHVTEILIKPFNLGVLIAATQRALKRKKSK
jgi:two-component system KDP operon response regulator KdpE